MRADLEALALAQEMVEGLGAVLRGHDGGQFVVADIKFTKQVTIYHVFDSFRFRPCPPRQGGLAGSRPRRGARGTARPARLARSVQHRTRLPAASVRLNQEKRKTTPPRKGWTYANIYYKSSPFKDNRDLIERGHAPGH